jgi:hypothetical protein
MKKTQKWIALLMLIVPITILTFFITISDISIKEFPLWAIIGIPTLILVSPFTFLFAQRSGQSMYNASLQKQKKRFLTVWGIYIIFLVILLIVLYFLNYQFFLAFLFIQTAFLLSVLFMKFRLFFTKNYESTEDDNQNNQKD